MTDKVQKIREEIEKLKSQLLKGACASQIAMETRCKEEAYDEVLTILDSIQEKHVSNVWHDAKIDPPQAKKKILATNEYGTCKVDYAVNMALYWPKVIKWAYIDDLLNLDNSCQSCKNLQEEPVSEELEEAAKNHAVERYRATRDMVLAEKCKWSFKAGAEWQKTKDESTTEDLGEYINDLSKQFPEVSFAKLSRIAVRVAKWKTEHLWKHADGNDLPIFDREVIVLIKYNAQRNIHDEEYPTYRVGFGHRPNPNGWDGKSIANGKVEHYTPKTYDKGGWNIPDVKWWLDIELPKEIEL